MQKSFEKYLSDEDKAVLGVYGSKNGVGIGARPAVLVVDATYAFVGELREPTVEAAKRRRTACGVRAWRAVDAMRGVLDAAHAKGLPVIYTKGSTRPDLQKLGASLLKTSPKLGSGKGRNLRDPNDVVDEIAPTPDDIVIAKDKPSAFFGTPLLSYLVALKVDSLFVTGGATSGCVRASAVDAFSNNYPCVLIEDCCFDRFEASHNMTLFDMSAKYAVVASATEAIAQIESLHGAPFGRA